MSWLAILLTLASLGGSPAPGQVKPRKHCTHTLAAGRIAFNAVNLGDDDHNLSVRGGGQEFGRLDLALGEAATLPLTLAAGSYTLYCSLTGHEEAGMRADISVR